jgi:hypothetical protein
MRKSRSAGSFSEMIRKAAAWEREAAAREWEARSAVCAHAIECGESALGAFLNERRGGVIDRNAVPTVEEVLANGFGISQAWKLFLDLPEAVRLIEKYPDLAATHALEFTTRIRQDINMLFVLTDEELQDWKHIGDYAARKEAELRAAAGLTSDVPPSHLIAPRLDSDSSATNG